MPAERDYLAAEISGIDALMEAFDAVGALGAKSAMQAAARNAVKPIAEEARRLAPRELESDSPLRLADSIVVRATLPKSQKRKRGGKRHPVEMFVIATAPHSHLVEFGHRLVKARDEGRTSTRGRGARRRVVRVKTKRQIGVVRPHPFMRPAFDAKKRQALGIFAREVGKQVQRVARRYARQAERGKLSRGARKAFKVEV